MDEVTPVDPEVAAATMATHLDDLWAGGEPARRGWKRVPLDPLHEVVILPAGEREEPRNYFLRLGAASYDLWPPELTFVSPASWKPVTGGEWLPQIQPPPDNSFA